MLSFDQTLYLYHSNLHAFGCQLVFECGVGIMVLVRCFADKKATENQITERLGDGFSRPPFATVVVYFFYLNPLFLVIS